MRARQWRSGYRPACQCKPACRVARRAAVSGTNSYHWMLHLVVTAAAFTPPPLLPLNQPEVLHKAHAFSGSANWLIPGHVLIGANPTKGRGSCLDRVIAIRCEGGCNTFVSLQGEYPAFDSPQFPADVKCYVDEACAVADEPAKFLHYPIEDLRPAESIEWLASTVKELAECVQRGDVLYVHCFAGRGRTGLIACCLLGLLYPEMDAEEALLRVGAYYKLRSGFGVASGRCADGMSPETILQRQQVRDFFIEALQRASAPGQTTRDGSEEAFS